MLPCRSAPALRLEFLRGEHRLLFAPSSLGLPQPASPGPYPIDACTRRLQDIVQRIGHLCLRPVLAHAMVQPTAARLALASGARLPPFLANACHDPAGLLATMSNDGTEEYTLATKQYLHDACNLEAPARTTSLKTTRHLLAWRIEGPRRVVLFTGTHDEASSDPANMAPHLLTKALLPLPSRRPDMGEVRLSLKKQPDQAAPTEQDLRARILHAGQTALADTSGFLERTTPTPRKRTGALAHSLEEAVLAFATKPPPEDCHARIGLHETQHWDKDHMDTRCV